MIQDKIGVNIKGIAKTGFITIGKPKSTGSLILKMAGTISRRPRIFSCFDFVPLRMRNVMKFFCILLGCFSCWMIFNVMENRIKTLKLIVNM